MMKADALVMKADALGEKRMPKTFIPVVVSLCLLL